MKGILLTQYSIGYFDIPKTACTSVKHSLYKLKTGKRYSKADVGVGLHQYFGREKTDISDAEFKFIIVRDPIKRFLSAYSNRVTYHCQLSKEYLSKIKNGIELLEKETIPINPSLNNFINYFPEYLKIPTIKKHTKPVNKLLSGEGLEYFNEVFKIEELYRLEEKIGSKTNKSFILPKLQTGGRKIPLSDLDAKEFEYLVDFYREDYELMKDFYTIDEIYSAWKGK